jgi:protein-disulfide isomerase
VRSGVLGTPTIFVNGEVYQGPVTVDRLVDALAT